MKFTVYQFESLKGAVIKSETQGGGVAEGISKFAVQLCSPMQETKSNYVAP